MSDAPKLAPLAYRVDGLRIWLGAAAYWKTANAATMAFVREKAPGEHENFLASFAGQPDAIVDAAMEAIGIADMSRDAFRGRSLYLAAPLDSEAA